MRVNLEQNSLEWHEYRRSHRNASEAGTIMNCNPFQTPRELWEQKEGIGKPFVGNVATEYGHKMEPYALAKVAELLSVELESAIFSEGEYSASLDAFGTAENGDTYHVEIKCPFQKENSNLWACVKEDYIPEHYYWQVVHQQICQKTTHSYLFTYVSDAVWELTPFQMNQGDDQKLMDAWDDFEKNPPEPKYKVRDDLAIIGENYNRLKAEADFAAKALKECETKLKGACDENTQAGPVKVQIISRIGAIDYKAVPEMATYFDDEDGPNLDDYRKKSTTYKKISAA